MDIIIPSYSQRIKGPHNTRLPSSGNKQIQQQNQKPEPLTRLAGALAVQAKRPIIPGDEHARPLLGRVERVLMVARRVEKCLYPRKEKKTRDRDERMTWGRGGRNGVLQNLKAIITERWLLIPPKSGRRTPGCRRAGRTHFSLPFVV